MENATVTEVKAQEKIDAMNAQIELLYKSADIAKKQFEAKEKELDEIKAASNNMQTELAEALGAQNAPYNKDWQFLISAVKGFKIIVDQYLKQTFDSLFPLARSLSTKENTLEQTLLQIKADYEKAGNNTVEKLLPIQDLMTLCKEIAFKTIVH